MNHDVDLAAPYVLDALAPDERAAFEAHLAECEECRSEVADLLEVTNVLPLAADRVEPSPALRARILDEVSAESTRPALTPIPGGLPAPRSRRRMTWAETLVGVVAAAAILALVLWNIHLQQRIDQQRSALAYQQQVAAALASGATVHQVQGLPPHPSATAALVQPRGNRHAYLIVEGLPATPRNKVYQLWLVRGQTPRSAGVFTYSGADPKIVTLPMSSTGYALTAVTVEPGPHGSARGPTGPKVMLGKIG